MLGIALGCIIGLCPLLFMEDEEDRAVREVFESLDDTGDGRIAVSLLEGAALGKMGIKFTRDVLEKVFAEIDADRGLMVDFGQLKAMQQRWKEL